MKAKSILLYLKNVLLIALAVMLIAGSTGLSYTVHYCHDKLSDIAFYPELGLKQSASCTCADKVRDKSIPATDGKAVLINNSCCKNISYFTKLAVESSVQELSFIPILQPALISVLSYSFSPTGSEQEYAETPVSPDIPLPFAGRRLVLFLSQQRIPANSYNC